MHSCVRGGGGDLTGGHHGADGQDAETHLSFTLTGCAISLLGKDPHSLMMLAVLAAVFRPDNNRDVIFLTFTLYVLFPTVPMFNFSMFSLMV